MLMGVGFLIEIPSYQSLQVTGSVAAHRNTPQHTATLVGQSHVAPIQVE